MDEQFESLSSTLVSCQLGDIRFVSGTYIPTEQAIDEFARIEERLDLTFQREQLFPFYRIGQDDGYMNGGLVDTEYCEIVIFSSESYIITLGSVFELIASEAGTTELERKIRKYEAFSGTELIPFGECTVFSKWEEPFDALICLHSNGSLVVCNEDGEEIAPVATSFGDLEGKLQSATFDSLY